MIDDLDRRILIEILRSGRISLRKIALKLNTTPQTVSYRVRRLYDAGVLKGVFLYINPNYFGFYRGYIAVDREIYGEHIMLVSRFECLDGLYLYEIAFRDLKDFNADISSRFEGVVYGSFIPSQTASHRSFVDDAIIRYISRDPGVSLKEISKDLGISRRTIIRRLRRLIDRNLVKFIPIIDISRSGLIMFSAISRNVESFINDIGESVVWNFTIDNTGMVIAVSESLDRAKDIIDVIRSRDRMSMISIKYRYSFYSYYENLI
jgi:DNA-binding Lrp family transcriptional regulator